MRPLTELKKTLFERQITQRWLAAKTELSQAQLSMVIRGRRRLKARHRRKIAQALAVPQAVLFGERRRKRNGGLA
jgi:transcriptional regulator with XRE-family HTH domain